MSEEDEVEGRLERGEEEEMSDFVDVLHLAPLGVGKAH